MNVSIGEHLTLLLYSFIVGAALGVLYDAVRMIRTFLGLGLDYSDSRVTSKLTPPIIGKRKKRERKHAGDAAVTAAIFVFDLLYMIAAAAVTVIFIYHASSGVPRGFAFVGEAAGFLLYMKTVGKLTAAAASYILFFAETLVRYVFYFTSAPILFIARKAKKLASKIYRATAVRAVTAAKRKRSSRLLERYIKKDMKNMLAGIAEALGREGTENNNV